MSAETTNKKNESFSKINVIPAPSLTTEGEFLQTRDGIWQSSGTYGVQIFDLNDVSALKNGISYWCRGDATGRPPSAGSNDVITIKVELAMPGRGVLTAQNSSNQYMHVKSIFYNQWIQIYPPRIVSMWHNIIKCFKKRQ